MRKDNNEIPVNDVNPFDIENRVDQDATNAIQEAYNSGIEDENIDEVRAGDNDNNNNA